MPELYLSTGHAAGEECSSTYEGRHVTLEESYLIHPYHAADGFVNGGDPVYVGTDMVGVAFADAAVATDLMSIDTEGVWWLNVYGQVSDGTNDGIAKALIPGDPVYIEKATAGNAATRVATLSGQSDPSHFIPFGYVLGDVTASTTVATLVAVKVHGCHTSVDGGRLNFGSGSTANHVMLLEGDVALRRSKAIQMALNTETLLIAGEQLHGLEIRLEDGLIASGGEITAAELKAVRNGAGTLSAATALKLDVDNKVGGVAPFERCIDIMMEGAGTAPAVRAAISVDSAGTAGTLEGWFEARSATAMGLKANVAAPGNTTHEIPIIIGGVRYCIPVHAWA